MKFASSFGKYEEEWKEGDWNVNGEVPVMMILSEPMLVASQDEFFHDESSKKASDQIKQGHCAEKDVTEAN
jgi:hypothetical protein